MHYPTGCGSDRVCSSVPTWQDGYSEMGSSYFTCRYTTGYIGRSGDCESMSSRT